MSDSQVKKQLQKAKDEGKRVLLTFKDNKQLKPYPYAKTILAKSVEGSIVEQETRWIGSVSSVCKHQKL